MNTDELQRILSNLVHYRIPDALTVNTLINMSLRHHENMKNTQHITVSNAQHQVFFIGDLHGQYEDLLQIFQIINEHDSASPKHLVFLGDVVDRGFHSLECLLTIITLQLLQPKRVHLLRGNHETESISRQYGFLDECRRRQGTELGYLMFQQLFQTLPLALTVDYTEDSFVSISEGAKAAEPLEEYFTSPLRFDAKESAKEPPARLTPAARFANPEPRAAVSYTSTQFSHLIISKPKAKFEADPGESIFAEPSAMSATSTRQGTIHRILAVHGGISPALKQISDIDQPNRFFSDPEEGLVTDILWADPDGTVDYFGTSPRGIGHTFGAKPLKQFMAATGVDLLVRAHQIQSNGFSRQLGDRVITVWSASNYELRTGNEGGVLMFQAGEVYARSFGKRWYEGEKRPAAEVDYFL